MPDTNLRTKPATGTLMAGKRGLVMGVANDRSVAWGIAAACAAQGAELAFTYQGDALEKRVRPLAEGVGSALVLPCDVSDDASTDAAFARGGTISPMAEAASATAVFAFIVVRSGRTVVARGTSNDQPNITTAATRIVATHSARRRNAISTLVSQRIRRSTGFAVKGRAAAAPSF